MGQEYAALREDLRRAVREEFRREVAGGGGADGPVELEVEVRIASGRR